MTNRVLYDKAITINGRTRRYGFVLRGWKASLFSATVGLLTFVAMIVFAVALMLGAFDMIQWVRG